MCSLGEKQRRLRTENGPVPFPLHIQSQIYSAFVSSSINSDHVTDRVFPVCGFKTTLKSAASSAVEEFTYARTQSDSSLPFYLVWLPEEWHTLLFFGVACSLVPLFPCSKAKEVPFFAVFTAKCHQMTADVKKIGPAPSPHTFLTTFTRATFSPRP